MISLVSACMTVAHKGFNPHNMDVDRFTGMPGKMDNSINKGVNLSLQWVKRISAPTLNRWRLRWK